MLSKCHRSFQSYRSQSRGPTLLVFARLSKVVHNSINSYETKKDATVENLGGRLLFPCMLASLKAADHEALIILN